MLQMIELYIHIGSFIHKYCYSYFIFQPKLNFWPFSKLPVTELFRKLPAISQDIPPGQGKQGGKEGNEMYRGHRYMMLFLWMSGLGDFFSNFMDRLLSKAYMVLKLDGNSEHAAHAWRKKGFFEKKNPIVTALDLIKRLKQFK